MRDVVVIGAGPAGLIAATYLARFKRRVTVLDGGRPRAFWIPESHNTPGFPEGIAGPVLVGRLRAQARQFGAEIRIARAEQLSRGSAGFHIATDRGDLRSACVLLATGLVDRKPDLAGLDAAILESRVRMCPICDGYEAAGRRVAVMGDDDRAAREALFLRTWSEAVAVLLTGGSVSAERQDQLADAGVELISIDLGAIRFPAVGVELSLAGGERSFDCLYLAFGCDPQSQLALQLGAAHDAEGNLVVDDHQRTSIEGLYAAGDVVRGLNQITVAGGEAAIAATDIHNSLGHALKRRRTPALTRARKTGR
jgi:thioredoxin reductase (NADPH)